MSKELDNLEKALKHIKVDDILKTEIFEKTVKFILKRQRKTTEESTINEEENFKLESSKLILEIEKMVNVARLEHEKIGMLEE
ncbi:MAG: hypothetical protein K5790_10370 [Nitrosopumilus sp.]|uniref:hypothetical protein n=1 Tax=Nitrosopumilus sp. TaxID=2024843 RepID=UPI00247E4219|nr:hypothetical protein [Nitrosopumilus sp.]MCV0393674.1 hypothetical protein [Nitrosopumilus sp.]